MSSPHSAKSPDQKFLDLCRTMSTDPSGTVSRWLKDPQPPNFDDTSWLLAHGAWHGLAIDVLGAILRRHNFFFPARPVDLSPAIQTALCAQSQKPNIPAVEFFARHQPSSIPYSFAVLDRCVLLALKKSLPWSIIDSLAPRTLMRGKSCVEPLPGLLVHALREENKSETSRVLDLVQDIALRSAQDPSRPPAWTKWWLDASVSARAFIAQNPKASVFFNRVLSHESSNSLTHVITERAEKIIAETENDQSGLAQSKQQKEWVLFDDMCGAGHLDPKDIKKILSMWPASLRQSHLPQCPHLLALKQRQALEKATRRSAKTNQKAPITPSKKM